MDGAINAFVDKKGFGLKKFATDEEKKKKEEKDKSMKMSERLNLYKDRQIELPDIKFLRFFNF